MTIQSRYSPDGLLSDLGDVLLTSLADNDLIQYDSATGKWENETPLSVGTGSFLRLANETTDVTGGTFNLNTTGIINATGAGSILGGAEHDDTAASGYTRFATHRIQPTRYANVAAGPNLSFLKARLGLGPELVTNGDFASDFTGWNNFLGLFDTFEWLAGTLHCVKLGNATAIVGSDDNISVVAGKTYKITGDFTLNSGDSLHVTMATSIGGAVRKIVVDDLTVTQSIDVSWTPSVTEDVVFHVVNKNNLATDFAFDNISVKENNFLGNFNDSGDSIGQLIFSPWDGDGFTTGAEMRGVATQQHSSTNLGTKLEFYATPDDSDTPVLAASMYGTGALVVSGRTTITDTGRSQLVLNSSGAGSLDVNVVDSVGQVTYTAAGSAPFHNFANDVFITGDLTVDNPTFHVDSALGRVGVGTVIPEGFLHLQSVRNTLTDLGSAFNYHAHISNPANDTGQAVGISFSVSAGTTVVGASIYHTRTGSSSIGDLSFATRSAGGISEKMVILSGGNVGIGVTDPDARLEILDTTTQLKLSYDATNYSQFTTGANGDLTVVTVDADGAAGDITLSPDGIVKTTTGRVKNTTRLINTDSPYTVLASDHEIFCDTDAGAITVNLPAGVDGTNYRIINTGTETLTVAPDGAELLVGLNSSLTLSPKDIIIITYETTEGWW